MVLTDHARQRMIERNVSAMEVAAALRHGRRKGNIYHLRQGPGEVVRVYTSGKGKARVVTTVVRKIYQPAFTEGNQRAQDT